MYAWTVVSGHRRVVHLCASIPEPYPPGHLLTAAQHKLVPLLPFAALPICCAVALVATSAQCEPDLDDTPSVSDVDASVAESTCLIWDTSVLRALADLRNAYNELAEDPLWRFAMEGAGKDARRGAPSQSLDPDDAIYELARMIQKAAVSTRHNGRVEIMDPLEALLEFAQLGQSSDCTW